MMHVHLFLEATDTMKAYERYVNLMGRPASEHAMRQWVEVQLSPIS